MSAFTILFTAPGPLLPDGRCVRAGCTFTVLGILLVLGVAAKAPADLASGGGQLRVPYFFRHLAQAGLV